MPFDPTKPAANSPVISAEMRAQLTALKQLIDNLEANKATVADLNANVNNLQVQLANAMTDTSHNAINVADLNVGLSNPPQQWEVQPVIDKINELLGVLRR